MKASVEVSERRWALRTRRPATADGGTREVRRSAMRMRGVTKKAAPEE